MRGVSYPQPPLALRHDAVYHEILEDPQNLQVLCFGFVVSVLVVAAFGFKQLRTPRFVKPPCGSIRKPDHHTQTIAHSGPLSAIDDAGWVGNK